QTETNEEPGPAIPDSATRSPGRPPRQSRVASKPHRPHLVSRSSKLPAAAIAPLPAPQGSAASDAKVTQEMQHYFDIWSSNSSANPATMHDLYADRVNY